MQFWKSQIGDDCRQFAAIESADELAEAFACAEIAWQSAAKWLWHKDVAHWLLAACEPDSAEILRRIWSAQNPLPSAAASVDSATFFEDYLRRHDRRRRKDRGVYFTPREVARYVVQQVHACLQSEFGLPRGLAETAAWQDVFSTYQPGRAAHLPFAQVLDPAAGSGIFLLEVIDCIHDTLRKQWNAQPDQAASFSEYWSAYVTRDLLARLRGIEVLPAAGLIAQINLARKLAETGFDFQSPGYFLFRIANALTLGDGSDNPATIILGNPPFRGVSSNATDGIGKLLRGQAPDGTRVASYYEVDGRPLGERKVWLQDDYVKFLRYAHWQIEQAQCGLIGFVTNHGYLDNATFRGLRQALCNTFPRIAILDLCGNRKRGEADGQPDEALFDVEQGVAVGLFRRPPAVIGSVVQHTELRGTRDEKLLRMTTNCVAHRQIRPCAPSYAFVPKLESRHTEYERGWPLNQIMPVNSTAVVTARDRFVVAFDESELQARLQAFGDPSLSDDEIRQRFFQRGRSTKYPPGDTRGWKLAIARQRMRAEANPLNLIQTCLYRPFDRRRIVWADWMIDWPRNEVMQHLRDPGNVALIARRQMPAAGPCEFFWVTDSIALDGVIRSDNRGSESVFPLYLRDDASTSSAGRVNITPNLISAIEAALHLSWSPLSPARVWGQFSGRDVLQYIYAFLNSPTYKERYAAGLRQDFPRVFLPRRIELWERLGQLGGRLLELHLPPSPPTARSSGSQLTWPAGVPRYRDGRIWLATEIEPIVAPLRVWQFRVGTYQVCHKWPRDRQHLTLSDLECYRNMLAAIEKTLEIRDQIDAAIDQSGGWPAAFIA